jgi:hypothetical protein
LDTKQLILRVDQVMPKLYALLMMVKTAFNFEKTFECLSNLEYFKTTYGLGAMVTMENSEEVVQMVAKFQ